MDTSIYTSNKIEIPLFNKNYDNLINKSILLFGASKTGKSIIIRDMIYQLKDHIPNVLVISPTNNLNNSYTNIIPNTLIHSTINEELISKMFNRQKQMIHMYNMINEINNLENIFNKIATNNDIYKKERLISNYNYIKSKFISVNDCTNYVEKELKLKEIEENHIDGLTTYYKMIINKYYYKIKDPLLKLTDNEIKIIKYININPHFLIILDDCGYNANKWAKFEEIKEMFMNGRHYKITFIISFQDDKSLPSELRKNAFINIFTTQTVCTAYFNRSANNFSKKDKAMLEQLSEYVFIDKTLKDKNYKKLVYMKDSDPQVYYYLADYIKEFKFGSDYLWELSNKSQKQLDINNDSFNNGIFN